MDQARVTKFLRDVAVNVVANLIAAAIIYLGAVLAGVVNANAKLITASTVISVVGIVVSLVAVVYQMLTARELRRLKDTTDAQDRAVDALYHERLAGADRDS